MSLDDEIPDPPSLSGPQTRGQYESIALDEDDRIGDDYRREELEDILQDDAWADAFGEWAATTGLTTDDLAFVTELGLIDRFDFYWDPRTDDVGYVAPTVPDDARRSIDGEDAHRSIDARDADDIEAELDDLGRVVTEVLENDYLLRDGDEEGYGFFADDAGVDPSDES